jgi:hypothetical protein
MTDDQPLAPPKVAHRRWLGVWSLAAAIILVALEVVAIVIGNSGEWVLSTILAWVVIVSSAASFLLGLVAIVLGRGRAWGLAGAVISVLVNPLVQLWVLGLAAA